MMLGNSLAITQPRRGSSGAAPPALAYDTSQVASATNIDSCSLALAIGAGLANRIVLAHVLAGDPTDIGLTISTVTYDGVAMTKVPGSDYVGTLTYGAWYYLLNPPTGSKTCLVQLSDPGNIVLNAISYANVSQATPLGALVTGTGTSTNPHLSLNIAAGNAAVFAVAANLTATGTIPSATGNVNVRRSGVAGLAPDIVRGTIGDDLLDTGTPFALGVTQSVSRPWAMFACELKAA